MKKLFIIIVAIAITAFLIFALSLFFDERRRRCGVGDDYYRTDDGYYKSCREGVIYYENSI